MASFSQQELEQWKVLYRQFLMRVFDVELLSAEGDPSKLLGQIASVLLGFSCFVSIPVIFILMSGIRHLPMEAGWKIEHFFVETSMLVAGIFSVLSWDSVFPDKKDVLVLAPLPLRARTMFAAKAAALGMGLGTALVALNCVLVCCIRCFLRRQGQAGSGLFGRCLRSG